MDVTLKYALIAGLSAAAQAIAMAEGRVQNDILKVLLNDAYKAIESAIGELTNPESLTNQGPKA